MRKICLTLVVWGLCATAGGDLPWSNSGIRGPKYSSILVELDNLARRYPDLVSIVDYGRSVKGRKLRLVLVMKKKGLWRGPRPTLLMSGSTHGNEYLNIEDRLPGEMLKLSKHAGPVKRHLDRGGALIFIPILNPDGYETGGRENARGVDLNRDWTVPIAGYDGLKEKETRLLADAVESLRQRFHLKLEITVDYHCCVGALLHPWSYKDAPALTPGLATRFREVGSLVTRHLNVSVGTTGEILGYFPTGTTKDYYFQRYNALSFTYEGKHQSEGGLLSEHVAWWEDMVRAVSGEPTSTLVAAKPPAQNFPTRYFAD